MRIRNNNDLLVTNLCAQGWRVSVNKNAGIIYLMKRVLTYPLNIVLDIHIEKDELLDGKAFKKKLFQRVNYARNHLRCGMNDFEKDVLEKVYQELEVILHKCDSADKNTVLIMQNAGYAIILKQDKDDHRAYFRRALNKSHPYVCPKPFVFKGEDDNLSIDQVAAAFESYCCDFKRDIEQIYEMNPPKVSYEEVEAYSDENFLILEKLKNAVRYVRFAREQKEIPVHNGPDPIET